MTQNNILKIIGAFIFVFGIFVLLLSITNIFNDFDFIEQYNSCIEVSIYEPEMLDVCKTNVSEGLNITIRANQTELTTGQYLKIYIRQIIYVLLSVLLIIIGDYIFTQRYNKKSKTQKTKEEKPKAKPKPKLKKNLKKK